MRFGEGTRGTLRGELSVDDTAITGVMKGIQGGVPVEFRKR
jgi:hypothetical protein